MAERWPPGLIKRWPGYGIERFLRAPNDLTNILAGSEGTLAAIFSTELKISPQPREKGLADLFFVGEARRQANTSGFETRRHRTHRSPLARPNQRAIAFRAARDLLELDTQP
jgi:FAD/FMN-containing dehydrogenase